LESKIILINKVGGAKEMPKKGNILKAATACQGEKEQDKRDQIQYLGRKNRSSPKKPVPQYHNIVFTF
jgi:hypothetical protein